MYTPPSLAPGFTLVREPLTAPQRPYHRLSAPDRAVVDRWVDDLKRRGGHAYDAFRGLWAVPDRWLHWYDDSAAVE